jgi:hypothetical protein
MRMLHCQIPIRSLMNLLSSSVEPPIASVEASRMRPSRVLVRKALRLKKIVMYKVEWYW